MVRMGQSPSGWSKRGREEEEVLKKLGGTVGGEEGGTNKRLKSTYRVGWGFHPNLITSVYTPTIMDRANEALQSYALGVVEREWGSSKECLSSSSSSSSSTGGEGKEDTCLVPPSSLPTWNENTFVLFTDKEVLMDLRHRVLATAAFHFVRQVPSSSSSSFKKKGSKASPSHSPNYLVHARAARSQRRLRERYGVFLPLLQKHPFLASTVSSVQRRASEVTLTRTGPAPMGTATSVMCLWMMHRQGVRTDGVALAGLYLLVGLQPWALVLAVVGLRWWSQRRRSRRPKGIPPQGVPTVTAYYDNDDDNNDNNNDNDNDNDNDETTMEAEKPETTAKVTRTDDNEETKRKDAYLKTPVGTDLRKWIKSIGSGGGDVAVALKDRLSGKYHVMVTGRGSPDQLFGAALLSRFGLKVLVLCDGGGVEKKSTSSSSSNSSSGSSSSSSKVMVDAVGDACVDGLPFFPLQGNGPVSHLTAQQRLLAPALATSTDAQGGIRFAHVGTAADGYTHTLYGLSTSTSTADADGETVVVAARAGGLVSLAEESVALGDYASVMNTDDEAAARSVAASYAHKCRLVNADASRYYLSKITNPQSETKFYGTKPGGQRAEYRTVASRNVADFVKHWLPGLTPPPSPPSSSTTTTTTTTSTNDGAQNQNEATTTTTTSTSTSDNMDELVKRRSVLLATWLADGVGWPYERNAEEDDVSSSLDEQLTAHYGKRSMAAHVSALSAAVGEAGGWPVGGTRALGKALENVIVKNGGLVLTHASVQTLLFDDISHNKEVLGVRLLVPSLAKSGSVPQTVDLMLDRSHGRGGGVLSHYGILETFLRLVPDKVRETRGVPVGLPALHERRPHIHLLVTLKGKASDLGLTGADYIQLESLPSYDKKRRRHNNNHNHNSHNNNSNNKWNKWIKISFPSARDPTWHRRHPDVTTCVVTVEADHEWVTELGGTSTVVPKEPANASAEATSTATVTFAPKVYGFQSTTVQQRATLEKRLTRALFDAFAGQLDDSKVRSKVLYGPCRMGLAHTVERYVAEGVRPRPSSVHYPNLFLGGPDVAVDTFSGGTVGTWTAVHSVLGTYTPSDLTGIAPRNVSVDLARWMDDPYDDTDDGPEDLAVPYQSPSPPSPVPVPVPGPVPSTHDTPKAGSAGDAPTAAETSQES